MIPLLRTAGRLCLLAAVFLAALAPARAQPARPVTHKFEVSLVSVIKLDIDQEKTRIDGHTGYRYTFEVRGREVVVSCDSLAVMARQDGKELMNVGVDRNKFVRKQGDQVVKEVTLAEAREKLKTMLQDSFGAPLCTIEVDRNGKEVSRKVTARAGAREMIAAGMIANTRLFHVAFHDDRDSWKSANEVSMGPQGSARGELTYTRATPGDKANQVRVTVSGTLTNREVTAPGGLLFKDVKYQVEGEQTYDRTLREWSTGKLLLKVSWDVHVGNKKGAAAGTLEVTLKRHAGR